MSKSLSHDLSRIYVIGDSHTLTYAWQEVTVKNIPRLLFPLLVTGVKVINLPFTFSTLNSSSFSTLQIWHIRDESDFYTKHSFYKSVDQIPYGSDVISIIGEIDCREGFLVSVDRLRYKDVRDDVREREWV